MSMSSRSSRSPKPILVDDIDEEMDGMNTAPSDSLLTDKTNKQDLDIPFCGCISIRYYQPVGLSELMFSDNLNVSVTVF